MGRDCGLCSMLGLRVLKDFKKANNKLEKILLHDVQTYCLFCGELFLRNEIVVEAVYPVPKWYMGSKWVPSRFVIICGFGTSHTTEKSSHVSMHPYLILCLQCQFLNSKPHQFLNKKSHPNTCNSFHKSPRCLGFSLKRIPIVEKHWMPYFFFFFSPQIQEETILKSSAKSCLLAISINDRKATRSVPVV